jgi:hypothetical protein
MDPQPLNLAEYGLIGAVLLLVIGALIWLVKAMYTRAGKSEDRLLEIAEKSSGALADNAAALRFSAEATVANTKVVAGLKVCVDKFVDNEGRVVHRLEQIEAKIEGARLEKIG